MLLYTIFTESVVAIEADHIGCRDFFVADLACLHFAMTASTKISVIWMIINPINPQLTCCDILMHSGTIKQNIFHHSTSKCFIKLDLLLPLVFISLQLLDIAITKCMVRERMRILISRYSALQQWARTSLIYFFGFLGFDIVDFFILNGQ